MRAAVMTARASGTNIAFLGAHASYRHIRLTSTSLGPSRLQIDYKSDALADPIYRKDPAAATFDWRAGPDPPPESVLTGAYYQCNGVTADMVTADPNSWLLAGSGLHAGQRLTGLIGDEYDRVDLSAPTPWPLQILFHSPLSCRGRPDTSDVVYYTTRSGAGMFDAATSSWVCALNGVRPLRTRSRRPPATHGDHRNHHYIATCLRRRPSRTGAPLPTTTWRGPIRANRR